MNAVSPPRPPMSARDLLFVDTETTGTDPERHELLELAAIRRTPDRREIARLEVKIQPTRIAAAEPRALEVNGYTPERWADAVPLEEALERFAAIAGGELGPILVGHNVAFDRGFLVAAHRRAGIAMPLLDYHVIDTVSLAWPLVVRGLIERVNLEALCTHFGISNEGEYGAMRDVERTLAVYDELVPPESAFPAGVFLERSCEVVPEVSGTTRVRRRFALSAAIEQLAGFLAPTLFGDEGAAPACVEAQLRDGRGRDIVVEIRRVFGRSLAQLRREAVERAEASEKELALARVRIAKLEEALAARDGAP